MIEAKSFLVIVPNYYGKGDTIADAFQQAKRAGFTFRRGTRRTEAYIVAFSCTADELKVSSDIGVRWETPEGTTSMQWEQTL